VPAGVSFEANFPGSSCFISSMADLSGLESTFQIRRPRKLSPPPFQLSAPTQSQDTMFHAANYDADPLTIRMQRSAGRFHFPASIASRQLLASAVPVGNPSETLG
jgi:hypothetical protein